MALKSSNVPLIILSLFIVFFLSNVSAATGRWKGLNVGQYQPIKDLNDPEVQEIGKFAITEHNKEAKTDLTYQKLLKGESQVVAGTNYRLVIVAKDGADLGNYVAIIYVNLKNEKSLTSFKRLLA